MIERSPGIKYSVKCDCCGKLFNDGEGHEWWGNQEHIQDWIGYSDWESIGDRWYCDDCSCKYKEKLTQVSRDLSNLLIDYYDLLDAAESWDDEGYPLYMATINEQSVEMHLTRVASKIKDISQEVSKYDSQQ